MLNFIDNLIYKACGSSLLTKPEPSVMPDFEGFSQISAFPERRFPDEKLTAENLPVDFSPDFPTNSDESMYASKATSDAFSSTSSKKSHTASEKTFLQQPKKNSIDIAGIATRPEPDVTKLSRRIKDTPTPSQSDHEVAFSKSEDISPATGQQPLSLKDVEKSISGKSGEHSGESATGFGREKQTGPSISPEPQISVQHDIPDKFPKSQPQPDVAGSEFRVYQPAPEISPAKDKSPLSRMEKIHFVNVEPVGEAQQQILIKELTKKTKSAALPSAAEGKDVKTTETQLHKEVRVNIGRIEIKASQQALPTAKPLPQGFEDYLMARLYSNRYYF